jgi:nucleoside-diphosphate-sugar epimerase
MRVFVTGATGFIGTAVVRDLLDAGHQVEGLARSDAAAAVLRAAGAEVRPGTLTDLAALRGAAEAADGVIHLAFVHDFATDGTMAVYGSAAEIDQRAIEALGEALVGTGKPLVVTSGTAGLKPGHVATEDDPAPAGAPRFSERAAFAYADRGVRVSAVRLPPTVHGEGDRHGFIARIAATARAKGVAGYPGDGTSRWSAVHRLDAAPLFRLALQDAPEGGSVLHGVGEVGVSTRDIAEAIGRSLGVPVAAVAPGDLDDHFGWLGAIFALDAAASSERTQKQYGWHPAHPGLIADLDAGHYRTAE